MLSFALFEEDSFFAWHSFGSIRYKIEGSKTPNIRQLYYNPV
jgi:hypothetical protein